MANDQFPWLTPFSQLDAPGFAWRTQGTKKSPLWRTSDLVGTRLVLATFSRLGPLAIHATSALMSTFRRRNWSPVDHMVERAL